MATPKLGRRPAHSGDVANNPVLAVVAVDQLSTRRIAAALGGGGLPAELVSSSVDDLLRQTASRRLDAVVLACDPSRPEGLAAVRKLAKSLHGSRVVVVSSAVLGGGVRSALGAGASAFVDEARVETALAPATRAALAGQVSLPRELHRCAVRPAFSHREKQVLALVVRGLGNRQIALRLYLSESTVKSHLASAFQKLGVRSRKEAAAVLLDPDEGLGASILSVDLDQAS
ncbi:MAG: response regulator transcription factor [Thermoleophilaceae bacterium]|nr:response regulator transcription factor [Thermoleophilaceae bacterium]